MLNLMKSEKNIHACGNPAVHFSSVLAENVIFALEYGRASLLRKILYTILTFLGSRPAW